MQPIAYRETILILISNNTHIIKERGILLYYIVFYHSILNYFVLYYNIVYYSFIARHEVELEFKKRNKMANKKSKIKNNISN